jgi:hypothetical protein
MKAEGLVRASATGRPFHVPTETELPTSFKAAILFTFTERRPLDNFFTVFAEAAGNPEMLRAAIPQAPANSARRETGSIISPESYSLSNLLAILLQSETSELYR